MSKKEKKEEKLQEQSTQSLKIAQIQEDISDMKQIVHDENDFICPICLKYIVSALSLKCGHTFCEICLHEYLLYFKDCPLCHENMRKSKFAYCYLLDQMIHDFIINNHPEELQTYELSKQENRDWRKKKSVVNFEVGQQLDVRDPNFVWRIGIIKRLKICQDSARTKYLVIHYEGRSDKHDEEIPENSSRFAQLGFYTSRKDIPRYCTETQNPFLRKLLVVDCLDSEDSQYNQQFFIQDDSSQSE